MSLKMKKILLLNIAMFTCLGVSSPQVFAKSNIRKPIRQNRIIKRRNLRPKRHIRKNKLSKKDIKLWGKLNLAKKVTHRKSAKQQNAHNVFLAARWYARNRNKLIKIYAHKNFLFGNSTNSYFFHEGIIDSVGDTNMSISNGGAFMNNVESFNKYYREGWIINRAQYLALVSHHKRVSLNNYIQAINQYNDGFKLTKKHKIMFAASGRRLHGPGVGAVSSNGYHWSYLHD